MGWQTRSDVWVGAWDWYCCAVQTVKFPVKQTRSLVAVGGAVSTCRMGSQGGETLRQTRSVVKVGARLCDHDTERKKTRCR